MPVKGSKPKIKRKPIQQEWREICISTDCSKPNKYAPPSGSDPRFIKPKFRVPKSRKA